MAVAKFKRLILGTGLAGTDNGDDTITIDASGGGSPTGAAGGVLDGTYPNPGLAAGVAGAGLAETSDVLSVNVDGSTLEINTDTLRVKDGGVTVAKLSFDPATQAELDAHITDATAAHAASAVSFSPVGTIAATDVQAAIAEVASEATGGVSSIAKFGGTPLTGAVTLSEGTGVTLTQVGQDISIKSTGSTPGANADYGLIYMTAIRNLTF